MGKPPDPHVVSLAKVMLSRIGELSDKTADLIRREVDFYGGNPTVVTAAALRESCAENMSYVFRALTGDLDLDVAAAETTGTRRATAGVPLSAVMAAYRVGFRFMWESTLAQAKQLDNFPTDSILDATSQILLAQDSFTQAMTGAYRQQLTLELLGREEERSALVEALLFGQITEEQSLWETANILRLPAGGPYVVVAAEVPGIGKLGLSEIASKLDARDTRSAWRLLPDLQVGIVHLRKPEVLADLVEVLGAAASARVGISPDFHDLAETKEALRYARLAIAGRTTGDSLVAIFDESPLAFAAVSSPETMRRIEKTVLSGLDDLPAEERTTLVDTFEAWVEAGGSANDAAARIYVHPNTVRHRLRRIEERTGRSLSRPKDVAELCLAFEIDRRLP